MNNYLNALTPEEQDKQSELQKTAKLTAAPPIKPDWEEEFDLRAFGSTDDKGNFTLYPEWKTMKEYVRARLTSQKQQLIEELNTLKSPEKNLANLAQIDLTYERQRAWNAAIAKAINIIKDTEV